LKNLIPGGLDALIALAPGEPMADIGSGDGDLAFVLESLGCDVTAMDWPGYNANLMNGVRLMREEFLRSRPGAPADAHRLGHAEAHSFHGSLFLSAQKPHRQDRARDPAARWLA
jgi:hypothetical protein